MAKWLESTDKAAFEAADKALLTAAGYPRYEGEWNTPGPHVIGPIPDKPWLLLTERDVDVVQAKDGTLGREVPDDYVAPAKCVVLATKSPAKWVDAVPVKAAQAEPVEEKP